LALRWSNFCKRQFLEATSSSMSGDRQHAFTLPIYKPGPLQTFFRRSSVYRHGHP
jgi:hypothetical protein